MRRTGPGLLGVLLLTALAAAEAPWIQPIPDWVIDEDATLTVGVVVEDPDSNDLLYWVESDSPYLTVNFDEENMQVNCQPAANWHGVANVTVGVDDLDEARTLTTEEFRVDVESVNDCPRRISNMPSTAFTGPEDQCLELSWAQLNACFTDADWAWVPGSLTFQNPVFSVGTVETTATGLRLCPPADWNGNATLSVLATDGLCGVTSSLPIKINPVNDCPVQVAAWEPVAGQEDTDLVLSGLLNAFHDVDGNTLSFCILDEVNGFESRWSRTGVLTLTPPAEMSGQWNLFICITDGVCQTGAFLDISLAAVNDPPALPATAALSLQEDGSLVAAYPVSDVDSPQVFVQASSSDPGLAVGWSAAQGLQLLPAPDWNGQATVTVTACDAPNGGGACRTSQILVTVAAVNDAPVLALLPDVQMDEDGRLELLPDYGDVDSANLVVDAECAQPLLGVQWHDESGMLVVAPALDWHGQAQVTVRVSDGQGGTAERDFLVEVAPVNDAPVQPAALALELDEDGALGLPWLVTDVDGPQLSVQVASDQPGLTGVWSAGQLLLTALDDWNGTAQLTVTACDGGAPEACVTRQLAVTVRAVNDAPVLAELVDVSFPEDVAWEQELDFSDIDSGELFVTVSSDAAGLDAQWLGDRLRLVPVEDWNGQALVSVVVSDEASRALAQGQFTVTVLAVNDAPVQPAAQALELDEDGALGLPWLVTDVDGPQLSVQVVSNRPELAGSWSDGMLTLTASNDWNGTAQLTLTACDGGAPEACVTRQLAVTVRAVNDAPVLAELVDVSFPEDVAWEQELDFSDIDSGELFVTVSSDAAGLGAQWLGDRLRLVPVEDWNGQALVSVVVSDEASRALAQGQFTVTVLAVNDAPVQPAAQALELDEDGVLGLPWFVTDVDGPQLSVQVASDQPGLTGVWSAGQLLLTALDDWNGTAQLTVTACDDGAPEACVTRQLAVTVRAVNDAPMVPALEAVNLPEDGDLLVELAIVDVDGPALAVAVDSDTPQLAAQWLADTGQLRLTPAADWNGTATLSLSACDLHPEAPLCASGLLVVHVMAENDSPVLGELADVVLEEDGELLVPVDAQDVDSQQLVFAVVCDRAELAVQWLEAQGSVRLDPQADWNGEALVTVTVSDEAERLLDSASFNVTVTPVNDAPQLADPGPLSLSEDGELLVSLSLVDVDGPELALTVDCDTPELVAVWLVETGQLRLQPAADWSGTALVTLSACDTDPQAPLCDTQVVPVTVLAVNDAPAIGDVADQLMDEDGRLEVALLLSDVDNTELVLDWSVEPAVLEANYDEASALLELIPVADWNGVCTVTLSLDDLQGRSVATSQFSLTVRPVNDAPHVLPCADWACGLVEDPVAFREWLLQGGATADLADVDGDALELVWFVDGVEVSRHALGSPQDTLECQAMPAPAEEWLVGHVVLHAELSDGSVSLNPGGEACAWELDFTGVSGTEPLRLALEPAWPNPFNPSTVLPFVLETAGEARLSVFDLRGAQVALLAEGWHGAGRHQVRWEAGRLASGVYLAVLETAGQRRVQRITLLK
jgi:hypothetical protein